MTPTTSHLAAKVDVGGAVSEADENNNTALSVSPITVGWQFGNLPGRKGSTPLTFNDADGTRVTLKLSGAGQGVLTLDGGGYGLALTGTTLSSTFQIATAKSKATGDDGRFTLHQLTIGAPADSGDHAALGTINAATTDVTGNVAITGPATKIVLGKITDGHTLTIGAPATAPLKPLGSTRFT